MYIFIIVCILTYILKQLLSMRLSKIKYYLNFFILYFGFTLISTIILPYTLLKPKNLKNFKVYSQFTKYMIKCLNLKYEIRNKKIMSMDTGAVIIMNHQSALDSLVLCRIVDEVDGEITVTAKKELFYLWPFGLCIYLCGIIFIDRKNSANAYKQLQICKDLILKRKVKIIFFPEGTRNKEYTKLLPFKKGAFNIAVETQVPIIPVVFSPFYFINNEKYIFDKGSVVVQCLEPIPTTGLTLDDVPDLVKQCYNKTTEAYQKLCQEVNGGLISST